MQTVMTKDEKSTFEKESILTLHNVLENHIISLNYVVKMIIFDVWNARKWNDKAIIALSFNGSGFWQCVYCMPSLFIAFA